MAKRKYIIVQKISSGYVLRAKEMLSAKTLANFKALNWKIVSKTDVPDEMLHKTFDDRDDAIIYAIERDVVAVSASFVATQAQ